MLITLQEILERTGYSLDVTTGQRKYGGPPPGEDDQNPPPPGCEVIVIMNYYQVELDEG